MVHFLLVKILLVDKIHDDIVYNKKLREAILNGTPLTERKGSVSTFHSIATFILCVGITVIHFAAFGNIIKLIVLITVAFFWIREVFKIAHKVDRHFEIKRNERTAAINGAIEQTLEESMKD